MLNAFCPIEWLVVSAVELSEISHLHKHRFFTTFRMTYNLKLRNKFKL